VAHYVRTCRNAASVLELGAGSCRIVTALAREGTDVWGLELDESLLALGRSAVKRLPPTLRKRVKLVRGNMQHFDLGRRFEHVLLPYNGLYCLLSPTLAKRCLRSVHAALEPGGSFSFDVWNADMIHGAGLAPDTPDEERLRFEQDGCTWRVFESCRVARGEQRLDVSYTYVASGRDTPRQQVIRQRYYRVSELEELLAGAGFRIQTWDGNFSGSRFSKRSNRLVVSAVRE
jgi:SAM-dependent methyltransferase